jgi:hypothetical protein
MALIIMAESLFIDKSLEKKREIVMDHYQRAYHLKLRELTKEQVEELYKNLIDLKNSAFFYKN